MNRRITLTLLSQHNPTAASQIHYSV